MPEPTPHYHINLFFSEEDECWVADVPDLQYCSAFGDTADEAFHEIKIAMGAWLESWLDDHESYPPANYRPAPRSKAG